MRIGSPMIGCTISSLGVAPVPTFGYRDEKVNLIAPDDSYAQINGKFLIDTNFIYENGGLKAEN